MNEYFSGKKLYGDDFSPEQIRRWYDEEAEAYASLWGAEEHTHEYHYHTMNRIHGFDKIEVAHFDNVMGFGASWGDEFLPVVDRITRLTIVEPSDKTVSGRIGHLTPNYVKPDETGTLPFGDGEFDLVTCFGSLHHNSECFACCCRVGQGTETRGPSVAARTDCVDGRLEGVAQWTDTKRARHSRFSFRYDICMCARRGGIEGVLFYMHLAARTYRTGNRAVEKTCLCL
ncbi:MAG: class I SAM-dependent methyltransferase [Rikenellaceae bacterium]|nr:class I SAM-dependent methyltransferase [Rikenellaceae bacterium]